MTPTLLQEYANLIAPSRNHKSTSVLHTFKCYLLNARLSRMIWNVNVKTNTIYNSQDMEEIRYPPEDEWLKKRGTYIQWNILLYNYWAVSDSLQPLGMQHSRLPCPSLSPSVCSNSCPLSQWCCHTISSSAAPFSSCPQAIPTWRSFSMNQLFTTGGQGIGASASVLPMNIQGWFPLGLTGFISVTDQGRARDRV